MANYYSLFDSILPEIWGPVDPPNDAEQVHLKISELLRLHGKYSMVVDGITFVQAEKDQEWVGVIQNGKTVFDKTKKRVYSNKSGTWKKVLSDKLQSMLADHLLK